METRSTWATLWRERVVAGAVVLAVTLGTTIGLTLAPREYTASATVSAITATDNSAAAADLESLRATLGELVSSRDVLSDVAARLSVERSVDELRDAVTGSWVPGTVLVEIVAQDADPQIAAEIVNTVALVLPTHDPSPGSFRFTVTDPAEPPDSYSSPNVSLVAGMAAVVALLLAVAAAVIRSGLRRRVAGRATLESLLAAPVLATIRRSRDATSLPALRPGTPAAAPFRELRLALEAQASDRPESKIVVAGVQRSDGSVWVAANLAVALAQVDRRVLLIDGRLEDKNGRRVEGEPETPGLYGVLQGEPLSRAVGPGPLEGLAVLPAGDCGPAPTDVIVDSRFGVVTAEATGQYDVVVVLAPALSEGQDATVMAAHGSLLLVVPSGRVPAAALTEHAARLRSARVRLIGSVLLERR